MAAKKVSSWRLIIVAALVLLGLLLLAGLREADAADPRSTSPQIVFTVGFRDLRPWLLSPIPTVTASKYLLSARPQPPVPVVPSKERKKENPVSLILSATLAAPFQRCAARTRILSVQIGRPYVLSKCKDYPKFQAVAIAIQRSGFKIVLLLRLVPLLPFNMLNYLLSVTPVGVGEYMLASWLGMMPITLALVYVGTTLKDLSDVTHGWSEISTTRWILIISGFVLSVVLIICVTKIAKSSLEKALAENGELDVGTSQLPVVASPSDLHQPLVIKIDTSNEDHEK
ncbi:unnamed protein product [Miscanthus lutarioriparius]|uniref:VTT domain-containing protein n=1 Tax=Miscanthus lutarioriparius TaxID=422564 RepID=A0A811NI75_9POAL|nr:unnamed protein product [Miscanthus lutarioriparius]